jgi:hypothetical protein
MTTDVFYKAVRVDAKTGALCSIHGRQEFEIGKTYSVRGDLKLCQNGFHACKKPVLCFTRNFGFRLGSDVLLEVELPWPRVSDNVKTCGSTLRVRGLATVNVGVGMYFENGLFHGEVQDQEGVKRYAGNVLHSKDPASPAHEDPHGTKRWFHKGRLHRAGADLPAVEHADGKREWFHEGLPHRGGDLPAVEYPNGKKDWFHEGLRHRGDDLPAVVFPTGTRLWYRHGKRYAAEYSDGSTWGCRLAK